jgi:hypothetical protein
MIMIETVQPWMWGVLAYLGMGLLFSEMYRKSCKRVTGVEFNRIAYLMGVTLWPFVLVIGLYHGGRDD